MQLAKEKEASAAAAAAAAASASAKRTREGCKLTNSLLSANFSARLSRRLTFRKLNGHFQHFSPLAELPQKACLNVFAYLNEGDATSHG